MAAKYRRKPVVIEAIQWDGENEDEIAEFAGWDAAVVKTSNPPFLVVPTLENTTLASVGDWIIKRTKGEMYPCKPDIFAEVYEAMFVCDKCKQTLPVDPEGCYGSTCHDCSGCSDPMGEREHGLQLVRDGTGHHRIRCACGWRPPASRDAEHALAEHLAETEPLLVIPQVTDWR